MAITDDQYDAWLRADNQQRAILVEAVAWSEGAEVTRYMANRDYTTRPSDTPANTHYDDILDKRAGPVFTARMSEIFTGAGESGWGHLVIVNEALDDGSGARDSWLEDAWDGRALSIYLGDPSWPKSDFRRILAGVTADIIAPARNTLALLIRDKEWMLNVPLQTSVIGGTTANAGKLVPVALGDCMNIEPLLIDAATHKYQGNDGSTEDFPDVREGGNSTGFTEQLAAGTFTLTGSPTLRITCDIKGAKSGGTYLTKAADLVDYLITTRTQLTGADVDGTTFTALNALCAQTLGLYMKDYISVSDAVDKLLASVGAYRDWSIDGLMYVGRFDAPSGDPVIELDAEDLKWDGLVLKKRILPVKTMRLGYARNWTQQTDGLAGAVSEGDRALYARGYLAVSQSNSGVEVANLLASEPDEEPTLIRLTVDAQAECTRRAGLWNVPRFIFTASGYVAPMKLRLGQVIRVTHPRYGFADGRLATVVGFTWNPAQERANASLEIFV